MLLILASVLCVGTPAHSGAAGSPSAEYRIKVAFLYNFTSFVDWPEGSGAASGFTLCVLGDDPFGKQLDKLAGKPVKDTRLVVRRLERPEFLEQCQLVFIGAMSSGQLNTTLALLDGLPVLTVSDIRGFTQLGGIIEFRNIANKIRFAINVDAAETAGLGISSKLLYLASNFRNSD